MTQLFGGATVLPAPGSSAASSGATERGQALVICVCDDRAVSAQSGTLK